MANPLIKITNIKRDFVLGNEIVYVLKGIDLEINKGEYVALMGPSGSGKSTLMNLLGCLDTPTSGHYVLNGKDVSQMKDDEL
ncbi:macrolide ABC transporter ATP-binding protein, partial [Flavobacterium piscis]